MLLSVVGSLQLLFRSLALLLKTPCSGPDVISQSCEGHGVAFDLLALII